MSEVSSKIKTSLTVEDTIKVIRRCAKIFGSLIEKKNGMFQVKDTVRRTLLSTSWRLQ